MSMARIHPWHMGALVFQDVFAKLGTFIQREFDEEVPLHMVATFSAHDAARGNAILKLLKQFGVFPQEIYSLSGAMELEEHEFLFSHAGLTIVIQAIPSIQPHRPASINKPIKVKPDQPVIPLVPAVNRLSGSVSRSALTTLSEQIVAMSDSIARQDETRFKGIIYLTGLSFFDATTITPMLGESLFLPLYLLTRSSAAGVRVYHQAELQRMFVSMPKNPPTIADLEYCLSQVEESEEFDPGMTAT